MFPRELCPHRFKFASASNPINDTICVGLNCLCVKLREERSSARLPLASAVLLAEHEVREVEYITTVYHSDTFTFGDNG